MNKHHAKKRFGQNFLKDFAVIERIRETIAPKSTDHIVEIGPGLGALTEAVSPHCDNFEAIELDRDLIEHLKANFPNIQLHEGDALNFDFSTLEPKPIRLIGNLPYNISSPLLFHCLKYTDNIRDMHFMLQKEVAERIAAKPGTKAYGRLSIMMQVHCDATVCFNVDKEAFDPVPKVTSSIIKITPHNRIQIKNAERFDQTVKQAFNQRRKTLRKSLNGLIDAETFDRCNIDPSLRPENLSIMDFVNLSD